MMQCNCIEIMSAEGARIFSREKNNNKIFSKSDLEKPGILDLINSRCFPGFWDDFQNSRCFPGLEEMVVKFQVFPGFSRLWPPWKRAFKIKEQNILRSRIYFGNMNYFLIILPINSCNLYLRIRQHQNFQSNMLFFRLAGKFLHHVKS